MSTPSQQVPTFICTSPAYGIAVVCKNFGLNRRYAVEFYFWNATSHEVVDGRYSTYESNEFPAGAPAVHKAVENVNQIAFTASSHPHPCFDASDWNKMVPLELNSEALTTFLRFGARAPELLSRIAQRTRIQQLQQCCMIAQSALQEVEEASLQPLPATT